MSDKLESFIEHVKAESAKPTFIHHEWFVEWHLEIVERIALELCEYYPTADKQFVRLLVWLHDYGKILDFDNQYEMTISAGRAKLEELGFSAELSQKAVNYIEVLDKKMEIDLKNEAIEVQIVSSADGCSHMVGPFYSMWWHENPSKEYTELMADNLKKYTKDWERKVVLPEARKAFEWRYQAVREHSGVLPRRFLN
jgi:hypothetical protein